MQRSNMLNEMKDHAEHASGNSVKRADQNSR
jgi:hypothetical protein